MLFRFSDWIYGCSESYVVAIYIELNRRYFFIVEADIYQIAVTMFACVV